MKSTLEVFFDIDSESLLIDFSAKVLQINLSLEQTVKFIFEKSSLENHWHEKSSEKSPEVCWKIHHMSI